MWPKETRRSRLALPVYLRLPANPPKPPSRKRVWEYDSRRERERLISSWA